MKQRLRQLVRHEKHKHKGEFKAWSQDICTRVAEASVWQQARNVLLYHALPDEPDLQTLLDEGLRAGKTVLLPVVVGDDLELRHYEGADSLREGAFHILEPQGQLFPPSRYDEIELALVPGMAFDRDGHRLGRGRGYYDRLLPRLSRAHLLGICFPFQLLDEIPSEPHDMPVHQVL